MIRSRRALARFGCRLRHDDSGVVTHTTLLSEKRFMSDDLIRRSGSPGRKVSIQRETSPSGRRFARSANLKQTIRASGFVLLLPVLCQTCLADEQGDRDPRGPARDQDVAVLKTSELEVVISNNRSCERNGVEHRAGYNGIIAITSKSQPDTPFVPAYAGMNLEHYFDGSPRSDSHIFFEPRYAEMTLARIDEQTVELYQPTTPSFQVESWTRFRAKEPNAIDFSFRCVPHRQDYVGGFLGIFWASYINGPVDKSLYFIDATSSLEQPLWRQLCTQQHNRDSTILHASDSTKLTFEGGDTLFANESPLRYSAPFFYGRFRNMVLIYVFKPGCGVRFTHSPSGGGSTAKGDDTNPAWDYQLIVLDPIPGQEYRLEGRLIYNVWTDREDVLAEVSKFLAPQ